jgi:hypothetical protein
MFGQQQNVISVTADAEVMASTRCRRYNISISRRRARQLRRLKVLANEMLDKVLGFAKDPKKLRTRM